MWRTYPAHLVGELTAHEIERKLRESYESEHAREPDTATENPLDKMHRRLGIPR